jgi:hypothetical protein
MASDIGLVLGSEHRDLLVLADQCGRAARGLRDPAAELRRRLVAHLAAAEAEVFPVLRSFASLDLTDLSTAVEQLGAALRDDAAAAQDLARGARALVDSERVAVVPVLVARLPIAERRRMGKVFRIRRDGVLRGWHSRPLRQLSQTELYELARRAGLKHRSTMTQAQLQAAVAQWGRHPGHGMQDVG